MDYEDIDELESDVYSKNYKTPHQIQSYLFNDVYKRNHIDYLNSIEWDTLWLKHDTEEEKQIKIEKQKQHELMMSPFAKWF